MYINSNNFVFTYFIEVNILHSNILHHWSFFIYIRCDYSESSTTLPKHPCHWKTDKFIFLHQDIRTFCDAG